MAGLGGERLATARRSLAKSLKQTTITNRIKPQSPGSNLGALVFFPICLPKPLPPPRLAPKIAGHSMGYVVSLNQKVSEISSVSLEFL